MRRSSYPLVSGNVFLIIAVLQGIRAVLQVPVQVGAHPVPVWVSWLAVLVAGSLGVWAFRAARQAPV
jgi:hypothetical protein